MSDVEADRDLRSGLNLSLSQLTCFVAVGGRLSFSRAARELHLAQPWVSTQVKNLESRLGLVLFDRSERQIVLTDAGAALLPVAERVLDEVTAFSAAAAGSRREVVGQLVVGGPAYAWTAPTRMRLLSEFTARYPGVSVRVVNRRSAELLEMLESGELDVAFFVGPVVSDRFGRVVVDRLRRWLVVPSTHPLAGVGSIGLPELSGQRVASFESGQNSALHDLLYGDLRTAGVELVRAPESNPEAMILFAIEHGMLSVTVGPDEPPPRPDARLRAIDAATVQWVDLSLLWVGERPLNVHARVLWRAAHEASAN